MKGSFYSLIKVLPLAMLLSSCGTIYQVGVRSTSGIVFKAGQELETETNYDVVATSIAPNLKMLEGLLYVDDTNKELLLSLAKGYSALAFGVNETNLLEDQLLERESVHKDQAIQNYSKSLKYGIRYFHEKGVEDFQELVKVSKEDAAFFKFMDSHFSSTSQEDLEAVFFTAQSLGGLINLERGNFHLMAQLPLVKLLFDWACKAKADLNFGACNIFYGTYYAGRPSALGGDLVKGKNFFETLLKDFPENSMGRIAFIQFYLIPTDDKEGLQEELRQLAERYSLFKKSHMWVPDKKDSEEANPRLNLYNAIAFKRFEILNKYKTKLIQK